MGKHYVIDIYAEMDSDDEGSEFEIETGDVRCLETGEVFTGTFIIKDLRKADNGQAEEEF
jgi:hypothetical protein